MTSTELNSWVFNDFFNQITYYIYGEKIIQTVEVETYASLNFKLIPLRSTTLGN